VATETISRGVCSRSAPTLYQPEGTTVTEIVAVLGTTHHPFYFKTTQGPVAERPPYADTWTEKVLAYRETLRRARPDTLVMVGNDHFHQFFLDNIPTFLVGKSELFDGTFYNEVREFGIPTCLVKGDTDLADHILRTGLRRGVDFSFSNELKLDHSIISPLFNVRPELDLPIVPILTNCFAPPFPPAQRFYDVGRIIRDAIESMPGNRRVAVIGSGHFSVELGGPKQFGPTGPDVEFDNRALTWLADGDAKTAIRESTDDLLKSAGNASYAFYNLILMMGVAGERRADYVDHLQLFGTMEGYVTWYPNGAPA
jgi:protocatechuate 4,5-dioxygenase beta chain